MNIINKTFLKLALLPAPFYRRMGIDMAQLKAIVSTKLTIDDRRPNTLHHTRPQKKDKPISMATIGTMFLSSLLGVGYLMAFIIGADMITHLTFYLTLFFFMLAATLISDFTSVLIDVRDNYIILPKPVTDKTAVLARLLHILIHICKIVLPMSLPGLIYIIYEYGAAGGLLFLLLVVQITLFTIFFINALYLLILKITTPQRFQSIISFIQIFFAIAIYAGYQIVPRLMSSLHAESINISTKPLIVLYPLYWFAAEWHTLYTFSGSAQEIVVTIIGLFFPFICIFIVVKYLAPSFNNKLTLITSVASVPEKIAPAIRQGKKNSYADLLSRFFTRSSAERMGFLLTWNITARSRDFKLKVYPAIGYSIVLVVIMLLTNNNRLFEQLQEDSSYGKMMVLYALYLTSFILVMAVNQIVYSEQYKAAWIYYSTPLQRPGEVISGSVKAAVFKFYIPIVVFITVAGFILLGIKVLPNIILGLFNELLIVSIMVYVNKKQFPFSLHQNTNVKAGSFIRNVFVLVLSGIIAVLHYFIYNIIPVVIIGCLLSILATWLMMSSIKNLSLETISSRYSEE